MLARLIAWWLIHFCRSVTLAKIERAIIAEVTTRAHHARSGKPSPAQWITEAWVALRTTYATWRLKRTLEKWKRG